MNDLRMTILRTLAVAVVAVLAACGRPSQDAQIAPGTPIVLISIDTLRADRLPAYGYSLV